LSFLFKAALELFEIFVWHSFPLMGLYRMKNIGVWAVAAILAWVGWIIADLSKTPSASMASSSMAGVANSKVPVLVEFYADWCGPCKAVGPVVDALADELKGKAKIVRINVDEQSALAAENGIRGIPAFIAYRDGKEVAREVGGISKQAMLNMLGMPAGAVH
jgi:thioredoxin 1